MSAVAAGEVVEEVTDSTAVGDRRPVPHHDDEETLEVERTISARQTATFPAGGNSQMCGEVARPHAPLHQLRGHHKVVPGQGMERITVEDNFALHPARHLLPENDGDLIAGLHRRRNDAEAIRQVAVDAHQVVALPLDLLLADIIIDFVVLPEIADNLAVHPRDIDGGDNRPDHLRLHLTDAEASTTVVTTTKGGDLVPLLQ